ncbi:hypothetical protein KKB99_07175 [bacterium]|nr:hypothetical protein [bacterium]MBU1025773.1 hypothetical protein [bacterium]
MKKQKKSILVLVITAAFIAVMFLPGLISAGDLEPTAAPGPTMKTLDEVEPRIPLDQCNITISSPGSYYLIGDLACAQSAITIQANNVTIDMMGYSIIGPKTDTGAGFSMWAFKNIEIRNGTVTGWHTGVSDILQYQQPKGVGLRVINVRAVENKYGFSITSNGSLVKDCTAINNTQTGILIQTGGDALIDGNVAYGNTTNLNAAAGCTIGINHTP